MSQPTPNISTGKKRNYPHAKESISGVIKSPQFGYAKNVK
jgi:hypothetical protein